jgi:nitric oxide reductase large subunit
MDEVRSHTQGQARSWVITCVPVAVGSFGLFAWATVLTYERAPPQPDRFVTSGGAMLMTGDDILAGKGGFQKADLMDFGSLYGMGSISARTTPLSDWCAWHADREQSCPDPL